MFRQVVHEVSSLETHAGTAPRENTDEVCMMSSLVKRTRLISVGRTEDRYPVCTEGREKHRGGPLAEHILSDITFSVQSTSLSPCSVPGPRVW